MDFKRMTLIFLATFTVLNIFLVITYFQGEHKQATTENTQVDNLNDLLKEDNIKHDYLFSDEKRYAYYLSGVPTQLSNGNLSYQPANKLVDKSFFGRDLSNRNDLTVRKDNLLEDVQNFFMTEDGLYYGQEYVYHKEFNDKDNSLYYTQEYKDIPFYDESSTLLVGYQGTAINPEEIQLMSVAQTHISAIEELRERQEVISEHDAIVTLYLNNKLPEQSVIKNSVLGYAHIYTVDDKYIYIPVWFVWIQAKESNKVHVEKVNAFSNAVISTNVSDVK